MDKSTAKSSDQAVTNPYRPWAARFWQGMRFGDWAKLAAKDGRVFRISPSRWGLATMISLLSTIGSACSPLQSLFYGRRARRTAISEAPVFIIGHWRSGTTMLHELMVLDDRHTFPTTYECFAPNHYLLTSWLVTKMTFLLPSRRPMDNMEAGWHHPQEDEFALCNLGLPSPYLTMAFPNEPPQFNEYLDFKDVPEADLERWKHGLVRFMQMITMRRPKRIVLKSPPHTGRIQTLLEMFPDARFVHITRDPYSIFPSTVKLWKALYTVEGLQVPNFKGLNEYVFSCFERMYAAFEAQRELIDPSRIYEVRYEDLVASPVEQMQAIYEQLNLGDFGPAKAKIEAYAQKHQNYKTNRFDLDPELKREINRRWGSYMQKYGYAQEPVAAGV